VAERSLALLERGLVGIRDIVRAMIETYRPEVDGTLLSEADFEDLRLLITPEVRRQAQSLHWTIQSGAFDAARIPTAPVRQAVLNLLLNASAAAGAGGDVRLVVSRNDTALAIAVGNSGESMPSAARKALETGSGEVTGGGVGLRVIVDRTRSVGGTVRVESDPAGTSVTLAIPLLLTAGRAA
jgi:signal transduction histidine kinase